MLTIALCDDEAAELAGLRELLTDYLDARRVTADVATYQNPDSLLFDLDAGRRFDLYLLGSTKKLVSKNAIKP
ncbi:MAG: hypothetical protein IJ682_09965 [Lachnospiraceae bacterium]|nr:hypothetical protein [Lachnospiraceae bacterium]